MKHIMIDLETLGVNSNAPIVAIAAVFFDIETGELGPQFYSAVDVCSELKSGAIPDGRTIKWWLNQRDEARREIASDSLPGITETLLKLTDFIDENAESKTLQVWGNGATFDNVILRAAYMRNGLTPAWKYYNDQDVRTLVSLGRAINFDPKRDCEFTGERHHALADAIHQARYVSAIYRRLLSPHKNHNTKGVA